MQKKKNVLMSLMKEGNRANNAWNTNVFTTKMLQPKIIYIYCMVCNKRRDPTLWDDHFEKQEHKEGPVKQLERD